MKKIGAKKVFMIIGIVLGAVSVFIGGVFGVMALMGKFKTPDVYPDNLEFAIADEVVIEKNPFNTNRNWEVQFVGATKPTIESFVLTGTNSSTDHEVNKKDCYLWFDDVNSSKLITLCKENGEPLVKDSKGRYSIQCNEPIYYMVNEYFEGKTPENGKVVLKAKSTNETVKLPNNNKTIWIDRRVESVFVKNYSGTEIPNGRNKQTISVGTGVDVPFEYETAKEHTLKPFSKESRKEIELYFNVENLDYGTDIVRVSKDEINNVNSPIGKFFTYDAGLDSFVFKTDIPGTYRAYIAVFPTYKAKQDYESAFGEDSNWENKNLHRIEQMVVTEVLIEIENIDITTAKFKDFLSGEKIVLDLYQESRVYLNNSKKLENNLGLEMFKGTESNTGRFGQVNMNGVRFNDDEAPSFSYNGNVWVFEGDLSWKPPEESEVEMIVKTYGLQVDDDWKVIEYVYPTGNPAIQMKCDNGVAVYNSSTKKIQLLQTGCYLDFYIKDGSTYEKTNLKCEIVKEDSAIDGINWKISVKEQPSIVSPKELVLGLLVTNDNGGFSLENLFTTAPVSVNVKDLVFEYVSKECDLEINYIDGGDPIYGNKSFSDIIDLQSGSYNACVLVVPSSVTPHIVKTIDNVTFDTDNDGSPNYVLVGTTTKEVDGKAVFVNQVELNENLNNSSKYETLYMLQLKNGYQQTIYDMIEDSDSDGDIDVTSFGSEKIVSLFNQVGDEIIINGKYVLNKKLLNPPVFYQSYYPDDPDLGLADKGSDDIYQVYEKNDDLTIVVTSDNDNMLNKVFTFYEPELTAFGASVNGEISNNVEITDYDASSKDLVLTFKTNDCLTNPENIITLWVEIDSVRYEYAQLRVLSGSPEQIVLETDKGNLDLSNEAKIDDSNYLKIVVAYSGSEYSYKFYIVKNGIELTEISATNIFNENITSTYGFKDSDEKGQTLDVNYDSSDKNIVNTNKITFDASGNLQPLVNLVENAGSTLMSVTIGAKTQYLTVKTVVENFTFETKDNKLQFNTKTDGLNSTNLELNDVIDLKYNSSEFIPSYENLVKVVDVECVEYGNGLLNVENDSNVKWVLKKNTDPDPILTIENDSTVGWKFEKSNQFISLTISFTVKTIAGEKEITLTFESGVSVNVRDGWNNTREFYKGTDVKLYDESYPVFSYPVFNITGATSGIKFEIYDADENPITSVDSSTSYKWEDVGYVGDIKIKITIDGEAVNDYFDFVVKPNVIAEVVDKNLTSETTYNIVDDTSVIDDKYVYILQQFKDKIYGQNSSFVYYVKEAEKYYTDDTKTTASPIPTPYYDDDDVVFYTDSTLTNRSDQETIFVKYVLNESLLEEFSDVENLDFEFDGDLFKRDSSKRKIEVGKLEELNVPIEKFIKLKYNSQVVNSETFTISNKYEVELKEVYKKTYNGEENVIVLSDLTTYLIDNIITTNASGFKLKDVKIEANEVISVENITETGFTIKSYLNKIPTINKIIFTFEKGKAGDPDYQTLTYSTDSQETYEFVIKPYVPETKTTFDVAYSGSAYDLLTGIFDADDDGSENDLYEDDNIASLVVLGVWDDESKSESITGSIVNGFAQSGYTSGIANANCSIIFKEISGNSKNVFVKYKITYSGSEVEYEFFVPLEILNRQKIEVAYPEALSFDSKTYNFVSNYSHNNINAKLGDTKTLTDIQFEPVLLYTHKTTTLDFNQKDNKMVQRAIVENRSGLAETKVKTVELVAYSDVNTGFAFDGKFKIDGKSLNFENGKIIFPSVGDTGVYGALIFKLITPSGNYAYYCVYINVAEANSGLDSSNQVYVVAYTNSSAFELDDYTSKNNDSHETRIVTGSTTYLSLPGSPGLVESLNTDDFLIKNLGYSYNSAGTKVFLTDITETGVENSNVNYSGRMLLQSDTTIPLDEKFKTITLSLVWDNSPFIFSFGTIKIYLQPETNVNVNDDPSIINQFIIDGTQTFKYELPDGKFTADVKASAEKIKCPFDGAWNAEILEIDGDEYDTVHNTKHQKYEVINNSEISLEERVLVKTKVYVKYTRSNTIVFVDYSFLATEIPDQGALNVSSVTIGEFDSGFNNTINLISTTDKQGLISNKEFFFGTYGAGTYGTDTKIQVRNALGAFVDIETSSFVNNVKRIPDYELEFNQTHEDQEIIIKIIYLKLNNEVRFFKFNVKKGYSYEITGSGASEDDRLKTTYMNDYTSQIGSTLSVSKSEPSYTTYTIEGLKLHTNVDSKLQITFGEDYNYVLDSLGNTILTSGTGLPFLSAGTINFVHSAQPKHMIATIEVLSDTTPVVKYGEYHLYLEVVQTYSELRATYLTTDANHENVKKGDKIEYTSGTVNLGTKLLINDRFDLYLGEYNKSANIDKMGFTNPSNPNFINFACDEGVATLTKKYYLDDPEQQLLGYGIEFSSSIEKNTECPVYLSNKTGINGALYRFQIMNSTECVDGLDFSKSNGYHGTYQDSSTTPVTNVEYVSFVVNDYQITNGYKRLVLGKLLDGLNSGQFTVDSAEFYDHNISDWKDVSPTVPVGNLVGGFTKAIQYKISAYEKDFYLTLNNEDKLITLCCPEGLPATDRLIFELKLGGVNGPGTVADGLRVVLSYEKITPKDVGSVYGGNTINLSDLFTVYPLTLTYDNPLSFKFIGGSYQFTDQGEGEPTKVTISPNINYLFSYNDTNSTLTFEQVSNKVDAAINFRVLSGNYILKEITSEITVLRNRAIVVNGADYLSNKETYDPLTNFVLTADPDESFSLEKQFSTEKPANNPSILNNVEYYNTLLFNVYDVEKATKISSISGVTVSHISSTDSTAWEFIKDANRNPIGIEFIKDFTGSIVLKLSIENSNSGTYYVIWTINCTGIRTITNPETNVSPTTIKSGEVVELITPTSSNYGLLVSQCNITAFTTELFRQLSLAGEAPISHDTYIVAEEEVATGVYFKTEDSTAQPGKTYYQSPTVKYSYKINNWSEENEDKSPKDLYDLTAGTPTPISEIFKQNYLSVKLPIVPASINDEVYLVTYKVEIIYLDVTSEFYITYKVKNDQKIETYLISDGNGNQISSAEINVNKRIFEDSGKHYLDLIYYQEHGTHDGKEYTLMYTNSGLVLNDGEDNYFEAGEIAGYISFKKDLASENPDFRYYWTNRQLKDNDTNLIIDEFGQKTNYEAVIGGKDIHSVFKASFSNIIEYKEFMDMFVPASTGKIKISNGQGAVREFTLEHIGDGRFGINLKSDDPNNNLFNNRLDGELYFETVEGTKAVLASPFTLYSDTIITANKSAKFSDLGLGAYLSNVSDFDPSTDLIIGVGAPEIVWVTGASEIIDPSTAPALATISIPNGSNSNNVYYVKEATFKAEAGVAGFYSVSQNFYYIDLGTNAFLAVPQETANASGSFVVEYGQGLILGNNVKVLKADTLTYTAAEGYTLTTINLDSDKYEYIDEDNLLKIKTATLDIYKKDNPLELYYNDVLVVVEVDESVNIALTIKFKLPSNVKLSATNMSTLSLIREIRVPVINENNEIEYEDFENQIIDVKWEEEYSEYISSYLSGTINFIEGNINNYFDVPGNDSLKLICTITYNNLSYKIEITIDNPALAS